MTQPPWTEAIKPHQPSVARIYDLFLGGKDNFASDRAAAEAIKEKVPYFQPTVRENRRFLQRAVRFLTDAGVRQILDIGTGLPTAGNVHEIASQARVVYVDYDPIVVHHANALLATETDRVRVVAGDARWPNNILTHPDVRNFLEWREPIGLLMVGLLHFVTDDDGAHDIVEQFKAALAPGSYLVISHGTYDYNPPAEWVQTVQDQYRPSNAEPFMRPKEQVELFFAGCDMVEPGLVNATQWRPDGESEGLPPEQIALYGGVGRIRADVW
ncbi:SAM-dependent methyltransferase [Nonomuraea sp. NPDC050202]|uniref:SAM-dependent methyltransferase n=1 Tax=Nonomuraea sp. NPDC050202 TaxID=3155035 RepID=UPI0033CE1C2C